MPGNEAMMLIEVLDAIQDAPESVEIIVGLINDPGPDERERPEPVDERGVRIAVEQLLARDFVVVEGTTDGRPGCVQIRTLEGFKAPDLWVRPTDAGTSWLHEHAPPDWYP
jgi:hypothetical protein